VYGGETGLELNLTMQYFITLQYNLQANDVCSPSSEGSQVSRFRPSSVRVSKRVPNTRGEVIEVPRGLVKRLTFPEMNKASIGDPKVVHSPLSLEHI
jgi:hypothetical protein